MSAGLVLLSLGAADLAQTGTNSEQAWRPLFDGKTLTNWQSTKFVG